MLFGGWIGLGYPSLRKRYLHLVLSFSGAYLLAIMAIHILPETFSHASAKPGFTILAGFFLQILFESLSNGVEHGHIHAHKGHLALPVLIGLSLHALLEGSPLNLLEDTIHVGHDHNHLFTGLLLHKIPAGFALSVLLVSAGYRKAVVWTLLILFAMMSPLGAFFASAFITPDTLPYLLGLVTGSLLHVSTTILFEADDKHHHRISWLKIGAILAGFAIAVLGISF